jgi:hypothetical protein
MIKVNLINKDMLIACTNISSNVDESKISPVVEAVQRLYLRPILGNNLYDAVLTHEKAYIDSISTDPQVLVPVPAPYSTLLEGYIYDFLINRVAAELVMFLSVTTANGGVFRHSSENGNEATSDELHNIIDLYESRAKVAEMQLQAYLEEHEASFVEYDTEEDWETAPKETVKSRGGWYGI